MRSSFPSTLLAALLATGPAAVLARPAAAQVSVDLHALDKLPASHPSDGAASGSSAADTSAAARRHHADDSRHAERHHARDTHAEPAEPRGAAGKADSRTAHAKPAAAATAAARPPAATLPTVAPPPVVLPPDHPAAAAATAGAAKPPVAADAGGDTSWLVDGMRVSFAPGRFDLSPETQEALKHLAGMVPHSDNVTLDVRAYAAAMPDDPSAARRLSLSRSLAIRAELMAAGIPSTRIFLRALGPAAGNGPADRCDIMVSRLGAEPPVPGQPTHPAPMAAAAPRPSPESGAAPTARP